MNKIFVYVGIGIALIISGLYLYFNDREFVVHIPEQVIREKLNEKLPLSKTYFFIFEVSLDNPRVELDSGNKRIAIGLDVLLNIKVNGNDRPLAGSVDASGTIEYIAQEGAFYLNEPIIEKLSIDGLSEKHKSKASTVVEKALTSFYSSRPIYSLKTSDVKQATAKMILKNLVVEEKAIVVTLGI